MRVPQAIGDLPQAVQGKLLQLLQSRQYYPLGSSRSTRADIRVIAATNQDLEASVRDGRFREDLYYRLGVLTMRVPALSERREDIPLLAQHFCASACEKHHLPRVELSDELLRALRIAEWPGNVRQLAHAIEAAAIRCAGSGLEHVVRTNIYVTDPVYWDDVARAHGEAFRHVRPAATCVVARLLDPAWKVEIEAEAMVP